MIYFRPLPAIQALSFDLDDTLYDNHPYIVGAEKKLQAFIDQQFPDAAGKDIKFWRGVKKALLQSQPELASDMGALRKNTLRNGLAKSGYSGKQLDDAVQACFDYFYFERSNFTVDETICSLLSQLAESVPLVAITNGNVNLQQIGIADYFEAVFHAHAGQPMKPHPMMFERASEALSLPPGQILHVGDNLEKDVQGAANAGFRTAWYAHNRAMSLNHEPATVLPDVWLPSLDLLLEVVG